MSDAPGAKLLGMELFPDVSEEIDRRIKHSEQRIKYWVVGGIVVHMFTLLLALIPAVFYLGQISRDISEASKAVTEQKSELRAMTQESTSWRSERVIWESNAEQWMITKGFIPPRQRMSQ